MKVGRPVKTVPAPLVTWGKYKTIWNTVMEMHNGDWLPVTCDSAKEATNLYCAAQTHRKLSLQARKSGLVVYIQKKPDTSAVSGDSVDTEQQSGV